MGIGWKYCVFRMEDFIFNSSYCLGVGWGGGGAELVAGEDAALQLLRISDGGSRNCCGSVVTIALLCSSRNNIHFEQNMIALEWCDFFFSLSVSGFSHLPVLFSFGWFCACVILF